MSDRIKLKGSKIGFSLERAELLVEEKRVNSEGEGGRGEKGRAVSRCFEEI